MESKYKESKEFINLLSDIVVGSALSLEDNNFNGFDLRHFLPLLSSCIPGVKGLSEIKNEVLTEEDEDALVAYTELRIGGGIKSRAINPDVLKAISKQIVEISLNFVRIRNLIGKIDV